MEKNKITINDIAARLGLSKTTVSRAISGKGRVGAETRKLVLDYVEKHSYRPNAIAKSLAFSKTFNIAVVLPPEVDTAATPFFQKALIGISEAAACRDYDVLVTTASELDVNSLKRVTDNHKADAFILTRSLFHDAPAELLKGLGVPFVVIGTTSDEEIIQIDNDVPEACCELTSLLIKTGLKSIALVVGSQEYIVNKARYDGFLKGFGDCGKTVDPTLVFTNSNNQSAIDGAVSRILEKKADCIIAGDDLICSRILTKLQSKGKNVPSDIKVASFYNSFYLENHNPPISCVNVDAKALGVIAANTVLKLLSGKEVKRKITVPYEIVLKQSTS